MTLTGHGRLAGVLGWPVAHSRSPQLHGHWLQRYGLDGAYVPLAVAPGDLERAVQALPRLGFRGFNVTVPHKEAVAGLVDQIDPAARRIGAVNTVVADDDGRLRGSNTDGFGFIEAMRDRLPGWQPSGAVVVLGAGGAARAVVAALQDCGAVQIRLANRSPQRSEALIADLGGTIETVDWAQRAAALAGAVLVVNTTTLGMTGQPPLDLDLAELGPEAAVFDIVYTPLETPLLQSARRRGLQAVDGLGMLLHQARPGFRAWFGVDPVVDAPLRAAVLAA